jgi:FixJ family two-component response regulator
MDGWTFRRIQNEDPRLAAIPVVVCSAWGDVRHEEAFRGVADFYPKPVDLMQLADAVKRYAHL